jgi:hypothetical protein
MAEDWAKGHDMEALPPDPFTAQRYFTCGNCGVSGHITPTGVTSGEASYQPCAESKED